VTALLVSHRFNTAHGARLAAAAARDSVRAEVISLPPDPTARLADAVCARAEIAFFSGDVFPDHSRQFFSAVRKAGRLKWLHVFNVGVDHPIYTEMLERGVRLTTSSGSASVAIAQTAIAALLALARGFPHWLTAQRRREWTPLRAEASPRDLRGQTAVVLGLGRIGTEIARLAQALGLTVIGVRRGRQRRAGAGNLSRQSRPLASRRATGERSSKTINRMAAARGWTEDGWCGCPSPLRMTVPAVSNDNREEKP